MDAVSKFLKSSAGKIAVPVAMVLLLGVVVYEVRGFFGRSDAASMANKRVFVCSETGKSFGVELDELNGKTIPVDSPYSGKKTGYPAELCYWTKEGKTKADPTAVLLNTWIDKSGPTFCPDCGRLVVPHNPYPTPGMLPPPTHDEYKK